MPKPRILDNLGDADPIANGGYFIWSDGGAEWLDEPPDDSRPGKEEWIVYRFNLDQCRTILEDDQWHLVTERLAQYRLEKNPDAEGWIVHREWFQNSLEEIATTCDYPRGADGLRMDLCSPDILTRAWAYRDIGSYHGFSNLDAYPLTLTRAEVNARYRSVLRTLTRRRRTPRRPDHHAV